MATAAADVQSLFLQVDASVELLRRNLASGEQPLNQFEQRAMKMATSVEKSIGQMGKNLGPFAQAAQSAAQQAQRSFEDSFSQIQRMAAKSIQMPAVQGGGLNLGAAEARQAAEEARRLATNFGLIETAARAAAAGEGVMTQETRLYLQAASAARIEAERHAAELVREAGALERLEIETRAAAGGQQVLITGQRGVVTSSAQQRQATMMLGQQVQDFAVQVVSGQSALIAFSQQIGQAGFAAQGMTGKIGALGKFLASGWGSAILVATTVLVPLVGKMMEHNNELDEAVDKLKKDASAAAIADQAHRTFTSTLEGQIATQRRLNEEMERGLKSRQQVNRENLRERQATLAEARTEVPKRDRAVQEARANLRAVEMTAPDSMSTSAGLAYNRRLADARARLKKTTDARSDLDIPGMERAVRNASIYVAQDRADSTAIERRYQDQRDAAIARAQSDPKANKSIEATLQRINAERDAALKAEQERKREPARAAAAARRQETIERRAESARQAILSDQISFSEQERQARRRLLDARGRSAATEEKRDQLARDEVEADYQARRDKIAAQLSKRDLTPERAATLNRLNDDTRDQLLRNIQIDRAKATATAGFDDAAQDRQTKIAMLQVQTDMATTVAERRAIQRQLLELEQEERREALKRAASQAEDPAERARAARALDALPQLEGAENANLALRQETPMQQYRRELSETAGNTGEALENAAARGFGALEDSAAQAITRLSGVRGVLGGIIGDLAQIAIKKLFLSAIGSASGFGFLGLSGGGKVEGRADGGKVSGPGTGTSDSILAMLGAKPIMLSNGESIVTAEATAKFWPVIDAMNKGKVKQLAGGGMVAGLPSLPSIVAPRLPAMSRVGGGSVPAALHFDLRDAVMTQDLLGQMQAIAQQTGGAAVIGGASMALDELAERNAQALS